jgi:hypothetical protein
MITQPKCKSKCWGRRRRLDPLHDANEGGHVEVARLLLWYKRIAMPVREIGMDRFHYTLPCQICGASAWLYDYCSNTVLMQILNARDEYSSAAPSMPLHLVPKERDLEVACLLVEHGANLMSERDAKSTV